MKISLNKALNKKNSLINKINKLKSLISVHNSYNIKNKPEWDINDLYCQLSNLIEDLIQLKTKIETANLPIREKIFRLGQYKDEIEFLRTIDTKNGKFIISTFNSHPVEEEYIAVYTGKKIQEIIEEKQKDIENLQEEIFEYNYKTKIEV